LRLVQVFKLPHFLWHRHLAFVFYYMTKLFRDFFESERSGGIVLLVATAISLWLANSGFAEHYIGFWNMDVFGHPLAHWVNDGLMTIFFLLVGLELERELYGGELSDIKSAALPVIAAIGGVCLPAIIYFVLNNGKPTVSGIGIPMATDIAFALGVLSLVGKSVPASLRIFLTAVAVIDDLIAIIVIAVFYTSDLNSSNLLISLGIFGALLILNRLKIHNTVFYIIGGIVMWYFMLNSGVHATITGVLLAFALPYGKGDEKTISYRWQNRLHVPVAFVILPIFALANTAIPIAANWLEGLETSSSLGIIAGLVLGKPIGIFSFALLSAAIGITTIPSDISKKHLFGVGVLGGIGFTMSIFITLLAFNDHEHINNSKIAIIVASLISGILGFIILKYVKSGNSAIKRIEK